MFDLSSINYLGVLLAAVANMMVGMLWYGPLFGKYWMGLMGFTMKSIKDMKMTPMMSMVFGFLEAILVAVVLAVFINLLGISTLGGGAQLAFWVWLGFLMPTLSEEVLWGGKPWMLLVLNASRSLVTVLAMVSVLVLLE